MKRNHQLAIISLKEHSQPAAASLRVKGTRAVPVLTNWLCCIWSHSTDDVNTIFSLLRPWTPAPCLHFHPIHAISHPLIMIWVTPLLTSFIYGPWMEMRSCTFLSSPEMKFLIKGKMTPFQNMYHPFSGPSPTYSAAASAAVGPKRRRVTAAWIGSDHKCSLTSFV